MDFPMVSVFSDIRFPAMPVEILKEIEMNSLADTSFTSPSDGEVKKFHGTSRNEQPLEKESVVLPEPSDLQSTVHEDSKSTIASSEISRDKVSPTSKFKPEGSTGDFPMYSQSKQNCRQKVSHDEVKNKLIYSVYTSMRERCLPKNPQHPKTVDERYALSYVVKKLNKILDDRKRQKEVPEEIKSFEDHGTGSTDNAMFEYVSDGDVFSSCRSHYSSVVANSEPADYSRHNKNHSKQYASRKISSVTDFSTSGVNSRLRLACETVSSYAKVTKWLSAQRKSEQETGKKLEDESSDKLKKANGSSCSIDVIEAAIANEPCDDMTLITYSYGHPSIPHFIKFPGKNITLHQFKRLLSKKGNFRYYFKTASNDFDTRVMLEEVTDDCKVLPMLEGKVLCIIKTESTLYH